MKLIINLFGREFGVTLGATPPPSGPDWGSLRKEMEDLRREWKEQDRWQTWQQTTRNGGGQFGFGVSSRPIEYPHRTWEP